MSLRVWLPLNGTLDNQGLDDITCTLSGGITVDNSGKTGKCYNFDGTNGELLLTNLDLKGLPQVSFAFWCCPVEDLGGLFQISAGGTHRFQIGSPHLTFRDSNNSSTRGISYNTTFVSGEWTHVACIYNRGQITIYINGVQTNHNSTYFHEDSVLYSDLNQYRIGRIRVSTGDLYYNGKLNDFRIYDHALSPMEVKQLSQGLILHYPLNRGGFGQENLLKNSNISVTNGSKTGFVLSQTIPSGTKVTFSLQIDAIDLVLSGNKRIGLEGFQNNGTNNSYKGVWISGVNAQGTYSKRISATVTLDRDFLINNNTFGIYVQTVSSGSVTISNPKIEIGEKATPWCSNSSDVLATTMGLNDNIEYDCSGYCNNGTRIGTFTWTNDTPKYNVSTVFNGSNYIEAEPLPNETKTISVWVNYQTLPTGSDYSGFIMFDKNTQMSICVYSGGQYLITYIGSSKGGTGSRVITSFQVNKWYHIVVLKTGATTREVYINGVKATPSGTNYWSGDLNKLLIGTRHAAGVYKEGANAKICDFRAYATLLSSQDILSLYHNEAYIDNNGNIYGAVYEEG